MLIAESLWPPQVLLAASLLQAGILLGAIWRAPWRLLAAVPLRSHLLFGAVVALMLLWQARGPVAPQVHLHILGMTTVTLLLGLPLALIVGTLAAVGQSILGGLAPPSVLVHALINATVPALVTSAALHLLVRHGPRNLFVYMLGVGFFGGGLAMLSSVLCSMLLLMFAGRADVMQEWMSALLLLAVFPEGFLNGTVVTALAVYRPDWLKTFDDRHFLDDV